MTGVRKNAVTLKGNPVDVAGAALQVGDSVNDFLLQQTDLSEMSVLRGDGGVRIVATVPSLDTSVCHAETRRFHEEATQYGDADIVVVSMDLPFAMKRWCAAEGIDQVTTLSAHRSTDFGIAWGAMIQGGPLDRCLTRAVFVVDGSGTVRYAEYCPEIAEHPNYAAIIAAAKAV